MDGPRLIWTIPNNRGMPPLSLKERQVQSVAVNLLGGFVGFSVLGADEVSGLRPRQRCWPP